MERGSNRRWAWEGEGWAAFQAEETRQLANKASLGRGLATAKMNKKVGGTVERCMVNTITAITDFLHTRVFFVGVRVFCKSVARLTYPSTLPTSPGTTSSGRHGWGGGRGKGRSDT